MNSSLMGRLGKVCPCADFTLTALSLTFTISAVTPWIARTLPEVMELVQVKGTAVYNLYIHFVFTCGIAFSCAHP